MTTKYKSVIYLSNMQFPYINYSQNTIRVFKALKLY